MAKIYFKRKCPLNMWINRTIGLFMRHLFFSLSTQRNYAQSIKELGQWRSYLEPMQSKHRHQKASYSIIVMRNCALFQGYSLFIIVEAILKSISYSCGALFFLATASLPETNKCLRKVGLSGVQFGMGLMFFTLNYLRIMALLFSILLLTYQSYRQNKSSEKKQLKEQEGIRFRAIEACFQEFQQLVNERRDIVDDIFKRGNEIRQRDQNKPGQPDIENILVGLNEQHRFKYHQFDEISDNLIFILSDYQSIADAMLQSVKESPAYAESLAARIREYITNLKMVYAQFIEKCDTVTAADTQESARQQP